MALTGRVRPADRDETLRTFLTLLICVVWGPGGLKSYPLSASQFKAPVQWGHRHLPNLTDAVRQDMGGFLSLETQTPGQTQTYSCSQKGSTCHGRRARHQELGKEETQGLETH